MRNRNHSLFITTTLYLVLICCVQRETVDQKQSTMSDINQNAPSLEKFTIIDTVGRFSKTDMNQIIGKQHSDTFLLSLYSSNNIHSITPIINGYPLGISRVYTKEGQLKSISLSSEDSIPGFILEYTNGYLTGYAVIASNTCETGKRYGFDEAGRIEYSEYSNCDNTRSVSTIFKGGTPSIRSVIVDGVLQSKGINESNVLEIPNEMKYKYYLWPDTTWLNN